MHLPRFSVISEVEIGFQHKNVKLIRLSLIVSATDAVYQRANDIVKVRTVSIDSFPLAMICDDEYLWKLRVIRDR